MRGARWRATATAAALVGLGGLLLLLLWFWALAADEAGSRSALRCWIAFGPATETTTTRPQDALLAELNRCRERSGEQANEIYRLSAAVEQLNARIASLVKLQAAPAPAAPPGGAVAAPAEEVLQPMPPNAGLLPPAIALRAAPRLAILVPFRRAQEELKQFVPHMQTFLSRQNIPYEILVINQVDGYRFNRGMLLDVGFLEVEGRSDYIALHDVDLLPINPKLAYTFPPYPFHVSAPWLHPNYHYKTFIGGIMLLANAHFRLLNGLSTNFWGWGREDDEFYKRIIETGLKIGTDSTNTFIHLHDEERRPRDMMKVGDQYLAGKQRDTTTGVSTVAGQYVIKGTRRDAVNGAPFTVLDVALTCEVSKTPWCVTPETCKPGYYRRPIKDDPDGRWVCKRCGSRCWKGFVLVGQCTQYETPVCLMVGRDISEAEAAKWPPGDIDPPPK